MNQPRDCFPRLRHLQAFSLIAGGLSLRAAARAMSLSQPALTVAIAGLEKRYGRLLFKRRPAGLQLTPDGGILATRAERCLAYLARAVRDIADNVDQTTQQRMVRMLTIPHLRGVGTMMEAGSFAEAAMRIKLRAPRLRRIISDLEQILGVCILEKTRDGFSCNASGKELARFFGLALAELRAAAEDMEALSGRISGQVAIGSTHVSITTLIPEVLIRLAAELPDASFSVIEHGYETMVAALKSGRLDVMCSTVREAPPPGVAGLPLFDCEVCILSRQGHPALQDGEIPLARLAGYPWVSGPPQTGATARFHAMFEQAGLPPPAIAVETLLFELKRKLILESDFLAVSTRAEIGFDHDLEGIRMVTNLMPSARRPVWLMWREDWQPTELQRRFIAAMRNAAQTTPLEAATTDS